MWAVLIDVLRLCLAPALVVASSVAGRRWGASVSGVLVGLPIVAGPILVVTSLSSGASFGARAASSALLGLVSLSLFAVVFGRVSRAAGWVVGLAVGWGICLVVDVGLALVRPTPALGLACALAAIVAASCALPLRRTDLPVALAPWPWWDLPARTVTTALLVVTVTTLATRLGPAATGVLAPFPIATSVVAAFVCAQADHAAVRATLAGVVRGLFGFAAFCFLVAVLVEPWGILLAFTTAAAGAALTQGVASCTDLETRRG